MHWQSAKQTQNHFIWTHGYQSQFASLQGECDHFRRISWQKDKLNDTLVKVKADYCEFDRACSCMLYFGELIYIQKVFLALCQIF